LVQLNSTLLKHICSPEAELLNTEAVYLKVTTKQKTIYQSITTVQIYNQRTEKEK